MKELKQLYEDKYKDLTLIASRLIGGDMYGAEDVVQEAFARAYKYTDSYDAKFGSVEKWFNSILYHCAKSFRKEERMGGMTTELNDDDIAVEDDLGNNDNITKQVEEQISMLKGENRHICFLYFLRGYKPREITEILNVNNNSVRTAIKRFNKVLRESL